MSSCLHTDLRGGVITVDVKDIPMGAYELGGVIPPRYSTLLINPFDVMSQFTPLNPIFFLSIVVPEEARRIIPHIAVEGFTSPEWRRLLQDLKNPGSLVAPPFPYFPCKCSSLRRRISR